MRVPGVIRVMVVDDHPLLREGIAAVLEGEEKISLWCVNTTVI
jgi:DNA-binding NarL/FixJ family response regulator